MVEFVKITTEDKLRVMWRLGCRAKSALVLPMRWQCDGF